MNKKLSQVLLLPFSIAILLLMSACGTSSTSLEKPTSPTANSAPLLSITSPVANQTKSETDSITFNGSALDAEDGDISEHIKWSSSIDGDLGQGANISASLTSGEHVITASVADSESLTTSSAVSISVTSNIDNAPTITITSPEDNQQSLAGNSTTFTVNANDQEDGNISNTVIWNSNIDGNLATGNSITVQLSQGSHTITATVSDSNGNSASDSIQYKVLSSNAPSITITAPVNNSNQAKGSVTSLVANADDPEDGDISANILWSSNIDGNLGSGAQLSVNLSVGSHILTATVTDSNGEAASASVNHEIQTSFGIASLSWVAPTKNTDESDLVDLSGFKIYYGENEQQLDNSITIDSVNTLNYVIENLTTNTTYYFSVTAYNNIGVESSYSSIVSKFIQG